MSLSTKSFLLTSTQQSPFIRAGEVVHLAIFPVYCPEPALLTHTSPAFTHSSATAVHVRPHRSAVPVWIRVGLLDQPVVLPLPQTAAILAPSARGRLVVTTASGWSTAASLLGVDPDDGGLVVSYGADHHCYIFIFTIIRTGVLANGDVEIDLRGKVNNLVNSNWGML